MARCGPDESGSDGPSWLRGLGGKSKGRGLLARICCGRDRRFVRKGAGKRGIETIMTAHETAIAGVFPQPQEEQWRKLVDRALKGASFDSLITKAYGAVTVAPLYPRAAAVAPKSLRRTPGRWSILGRVDYAPPEPANRLALDDLEGGADGLHLVFAGSQGAYGGGLSDDGAAALAKVFENIRLDYGIPVII